MHDLSVLSMVSGKVDIKKHLHLSADEECRRLCNEAILVNNYLGFINCFLLVVSASSTFLVTLHIPKTCPAFRPSDMQIRDYNRVIA
jgi:hypothetical protein